MAAQIAILFLERRSNGVDYFCDINAKAIDDYYYTNLDFDPASYGSDRLLDILSKLNDLLGTGNRPKLRGHDAIHLVLFLASIWDDYTRSWELTLAAAQDTFSESLAKATATGKAAQPDEFWLQYGIWTRTNADRGENIRQRHQFYSTRMAEFLGNLTLKDSTRVFGPLERQLIYWRDKKNCRVCKAEVPWAEVEIHHIMEHSQGGKTNLGNGALVHKHCHPKGSAAKEFSSSSS